MNIHEFQAKEILQKYGIPIPPFRVVRSVDEARTAIEELGIDEGVVKVQVHAGGRGKAGGVKLARSKEELLEQAEKLIGMRIVNNQTGKEGVVSEQVMITTLTDIKKEYYLGAIIDRQQAQATLIASPEGGVEIEEVAAKTPERILTVPIPIDGKMKRFQLLNVAKFMGWEGEQAKKGMKLVAALAQAFIDTDASLLEINPLVETNDGDIIALDAKLGVDGNALFRQKEISQYYDATQHPSQEAEAIKHDLAYIALDGNIGCMVNGAGLAMATMDIISHFGAQPANFLDVGGSATKEKIAEGFKIILSDSKVEGVLVNIFGGIMDCNLLAQGLLAAVEEVGVKVPLVVRFEGTNSAEGKKTIKESSIEITAADDLSDAAQKIVACVNA